MTTTGEMDETVLAPAALPVQPPEGRPPALPEGDRVRPVPPRGVPPVPVAVEPAVAAGDQAVTWAEITLNGCCSQGGGARGLVSAGHYVVGVDNDPGCRDGYLRSGAHEFICADILDVLEDPGFLARFTFGDFGPPCQAYSRMSHCRPEIAGKYPRLIRPIQQRLDANWGGRPYVIENVSGARGELRDPAVYCMQMFGRETYRHRLIEAGGGLRLIPPPPPARGSLAGSPGSRVNRECGWPHPVPTARAGHWQPGYFVSVAGHERKEPVRRVMEISESWMPDREAVAEAIPPYLGAEIARQLAAWRLDRTA